MPKYKVPKKPSNLAGEIAESTLQYPRVYVPADDSLLETFKMDDKVEVTIVGVVKGLTANELNKELQVEVHEVMAYPTNEFSDLSKDDEDE